MDRAEYFLGKPLKLRLIDNCIIAEAL